MLQLLRVEQGTEGTFGILLVNGKAFCCTLELPWLDNEPGKSCIPEGEYVCAWRDSPKFGKVIAVQGVPGRTDILIHAGNMTGDILGCILVGWRYGEFRIGGKKQRGLMESQAALTALKNALMKEKEIPLSIKRT